MGDTFRLAMQLTMVDLLSGVASRAKANIQQLGVAGKEAARNFELMERHATRGLKALAIANYTVNKMKPGVGAAADLQESMIDVRMSLLRSGKDANTLGRELQQVRSTAVDLQKITPFSAVDVVNTQRELMTSGVEFQDVIGKGAARAAMVLATITKTAPETTAGIMLGVGVPYHLKGKDYGELSDEIQKHVMSGRMKMPQLEAALPYAAPYTNAYGVPWKDMLTGLAVLGEQGQLGSHAGVGLKDFYERLTGATRISKRYMAAMNRDLARKGKAPLEFWDKSGELLPTHEIIKSLRSSLGSYNRKMRLTLLQKIFGEQGGLAALNLMPTGTGSWEFVKGKVLEVASAEDKMTERLKGFSATVTALGGTSKTTLATIFDPMLAPMTEVLKDLNEIVAKIGEINEAHPSLAKTTSYGLAGISGVLGGYGLYNLVKAGKFGSKVFKGLRGTSFASLGVGLAEGKAVEAATGVTPVFVTNWPGSFSDLGVSGPGPAANAETVKTAGRILPWLNKMGIYSLATIPAYYTGSYLDKLSGGSGEFNADQHPDNWSFRAPWKKEEKNDIHIDLQIDSAGRVNSRTSSINTRITMIPRGDFFSAMTTVP
ncbi:hypothetical protein GMST_34990 [Geomonas silvestris]|uniref:Phage tail tape measure protein domain-containing protein n=1 Tax=Geomonas silvestris TaxID=2740184 RepID=A0A6V8MML0_9BACT|nr:phage tail tape measure protein [Geomonas silvestris]GFO61174.1 hypothetical protein GMST_34990 [Geomonas silvestris]